MTGMARIASGRGEPQGRRLISAAIAIAAGGAILLIALLVIFDRWPHLLDELGWSRAAARAETSIAIERREHLALLAATRGPAAAMQITGDKAVLANAALPFSTAPILSARTFSLGYAAVADQDRALLCLTQAIYYEAGFEPIEGRRAVAQVVLNRVRHPAFPKSVCGVVYEGSDQRVCQFSFTCDGSLGRAPAAAAWREARAVAQAALAGFVEPSVGLATHYHTDWVSPYWAPRLTKLVQVGAHIFYRWPGGWGMPAAFSGRYAGYEGAIAAPPTPSTEVPPEIAAVLASMPPERRAENDTGGRLDVTKGWSLSIPSPSESGSALAAATGAQAVRDERYASAAPADAAGMREPVAESR